MWLKKLKIAVVQKDLESLSALLKNIPTLSDAQEIQEATYLLAQAKSEVASLQEKISNSMKQMKKNIDFLKSTRGPSSNRLDKKF
jgi:hypothetical protein